MNTPREPVAPPVASIASSDAKVPQLSLLRLLSESSDRSQRELSGLLGLSLGKTHYLLHALLDKGLVKARNFKRSDNKLGYSYLLTPAGMAEKLRMTREFLARKEVEFEQLKSTIALLRAEVVDEASHGVPGQPDDGPGANLAGAGRPALAEPGQPGADCPVAPASPAASRRKAAPGHPHSHTASSGSFREPGL